MSWRRSRYTFGMVLVLLFLPIYLNAAAISGTVKRQHWGSDSWGEN